MNSIVQKVIDKLIFKQDERSTIIALAVLDAVCSHYPIYNSPGNKKLLFENNYIKIQEIERFIKQRRIFLSHIKDGVYLGPEIF